MICSQTKKVLRVFVEINLQTAKHQTRLAGDLKKESDYRLSVDCLTKGVRSCQGPPDTSQSRLFPLVSHHAGGVGNAPV